MTALTALTGRVDAMERHLDNVEGELLEIKFHQNMPNWVRHYLKRPARVFVDDIPGLEDAIADGVITEADVERADERAKLLARLGLRARPFVAGYRITRAAESMTDDRGVLVSLRRQPA